MMPEVEKPGAAGRALPIWSYLAEQARKHVETRRYREGERIFCAIIALFGKHPTLLNGLGVCHAGLGDLHTAVECYREALQLSPGLDSAWNNLGNALNRLGRHRTAVRCLTRARALAPALPSYAHNLGIAYAGIGDDERAIEQYEQALALGAANRSGIEWDLARALLRVGQLERGWALYESRWAGAPGAPPRPNHPGQAWRGTEYRGRRLLVWSEQGFGDVIQCARYLSWAADLGGELVLATRPELARLLPEFNTVAVENGQAVVGEFDWQCSILDLPRLHHDAGAPPVAGPYLAAPPASVAALAGRLPPRDKRLRVGIVWSGSVTFAGNRTRAISCDQLVGALATVPDVELFNLQKGEPAAELQRCRWHASITDVMPYCRDFADTAALIEALDLVIMTDSAVAHLAGALGRPVWVLLEHAPHWLWGRRGTSSAWYPSMRFYRQPCPGSWDAVLDSVVADLFDFGASRAPVDQLTAA